MTVDLASLEELEPALAQEEFDVARVFVGYGASAPSAPEPCRLPAVAYSLDPPTAASGSFRTGEWHRPGLRPRMPPRSRRCATRFTRATSTR